MGPIECMDSTVVDEFEFFEMVLLGVAAHSASRPVMCKKARNDLVNLMS